MAIGAAAAIDMQGRAVGRDLIDAGEQALGDLDEHLCRRRTGGSLNHWGASVAGLSHRWVDGHLPQEWGAGHGGDFRPAPGAEDFVLPAAAVADEIAFVLDDAED